MYSNILININYYLTAYKNIQVHIHICILRMYLYMFMESKRQIKSVLAILFPSHLCLINRNLFGSVIAHSLKKQYFHYYYLLFRALERGFKERLSSNVLFFFSKDFCHLRLCVSDVIDQHIYTILYLSYMYVGCICNGYVHLFTCMMVELDLILCHVVVQLSYTITSYLLKALQMRHVLEHYIIKVIIVSIYR